jgi:hypothetical protein
MLRKEGLLCFIKNPAIVAKTLMLRQQYIFPPIRADEAIFLQNLICALAQFHFFEAFSEGQHCIPFLRH